MTLHDMEQFVANQTPEIEIRDIDLENPTEVLSFHVMWLAYLSHLHHHGGDILPTDRNLKFFIKLLYAYRRGELDGIAIMAWDGDKPVGCTRAGALQRREQELDLKHRTAQGWGTYVVPAYREMRVAKRLRDRAIQLLRELPFDRVTGVILPGDDSSRISLQHLDVFTRKVVAEYDL